MGFTEEVKTVRTQRKKRKECHLEARELHRRG
jgi:hypothetical protein